MARLMEHSDTDSSLRGFVSSLVSILLKVMIYIAALGMLGVETTSFVVIMGAAGLALSGTLQNAAEGVMSVLFKALQSVKCD